MLVTDLHLIDMTLTQIMSQMLVRIQELKSQNRIEDAVALYQEWKQQYDDEGNIVPIDFVDFMFL
jgi:hypothetical protein